MKNFKIQSFILVLIAFILGFSEFIIVGILTDLSISFNVDVSTVGYLVTTFAVIYAISTPFVTSLIGQKKLRNMLIIFMVIFTISNFITAIATSYSILTISRTFIALISGPIISIALAFGTHLAPQEKRAWLISWIFSGFSIASVFGVPVGTWLSHQFGWRSAFYLITIISVLSIFLILLSLPGEFRQQASKTGRFIDQFAVLKNTQVLLSVSITMFGLGSVYVVYTYLSPIFTDFLNIPISMVTIAFTAYGFMSLISNQLSGKLANRRGLHLMVKIYIFQIILMLAFSYLINNIIFGLLSIMILGLNMYLMNSPVQMNVLSIAEEKYPQSLVLASSLNPIFSNLGIALGSGVGGLIVKNFGIKNIGFGAAIITFLSLICLLYLNRLISIDEKQKK